MSEGNGVGHNSELTEEQKQALFFYHLGHIRRQREKLASVNGDLRNLIKKAKADGFAKKEIDFALSLEKDEDDAALEQRRREAMIARWMGHPIGTQSDLFDEPRMDPAPLDERAFEAGKKAGMQGETCKPPESTSHPEKWTEGWHKGQDILKSTLPLTASAMEAVKDEVKVLSGSELRKAAKKGKTLAKQLAEQNGKVDAKIKGKADPFPDEPAA